jgi:X-X-X-Leu-X-X-Gly heptad repeat protein
MSAGLGDATHAASVIGGLNLIKAGLKSGDAAHPAIQEGLSAIVAGLGDKSNAASVIGGLTAIQAGLTSGDVNNPAILEGLQLIFAGVGGFNADGSPVKVVTTRKSKAGHTIESGVTFNYNLEAIRTAMTKFFVGFGDRKVKATTLLSGLTQISDGLQQVIDGTKTGVAGADTLSNVVEKTVNSQDTNVALYQAGVQRAKDYKAFVSAPSDASTKVLFLYNLPAIG